MPERKAIQYHPICSSPPALEIYAAHLLSVTLALKSPFLCVKRSLIRYGFRAGTKAISYNVNIALFTICSFTYFSILFCFVFYASSIFFLDTHLRTNAQLGTPLGTPHFLGYNLKLIIRRTVWRDSDNVKTARRRSFSF